jgi:dynein heavy chain
MVAANLAGWVLAM